MKLRSSVKKGISFGLTSGTITTLGLMVGLYSGTNSALIVIGGIITIAIADAMSDALGIHVSEESEKRNSRKNVWYATFSTFLAKLIYALTFIIPVLLFDLKIAVIVSIVYGLLVLSILSYKIGMEHKGKGIKMVFEHLIIAIIVLIVTYFVGYFISFGFS
ncbi:MAG: hypothetical protein ABIH37_04855 [archaeon]